MKPRFCSIHLAFNRVYFEAGLIENTQGTLGVKPDVLGVLNHPHGKPPSSQPTLEVTSQFVEFTYYNDRFAPNLSSKGPREPKQLFAFLGRLL
jgi:hypothetical protein